LAGERALLVLAKQPVAGRVKTRLARSLGEAAAAELAQAFLADTLRHAARVRDARRVLCFSPPDARDWFAGLDPRAELLAQVEGDLGARLTAAFEHAFAQGATAVLAVGSDSPQQGADLLERAFAELAPGRVVLRPSRDGGYTLVGLAARAPGLFADIPWSTPQVCEQSEQRARSLGLEIVRLEEGYDVDEASDVARLAAQIEAGAADCPATRAALRSRPAP
jgi:rSAM/selenodomain-associated transferase 1